MIQFKNELLKFATLLLLTIIIVSFSKKHFVLDGGTINNPTISIPANTEVPGITATNASGCADTLTYQWQQSPDGTNFIDLQGATGVFCRPGRIMNTTHFRRKAICSNVATNSGL